jgi:hypothetical protein
MATIDIGGDLALPVTDDYPVGVSNEFPGKIHLIYKYCPDSKSRCRWVVMETQIEEKGEISCLKFSP